MGESGKKKLITFQFKQKKFEIIIILKELICTYTQIKKK
jgi:hypothetical protein